MKKCVRVVAESSDDSQCKLIFDGVVDNTMFVKQPMFGYYIEDREEYPFRILPDSVKNGEARLDWGSDSDPPEPINLFEKQITIGEYFTCGGDTLKIVKIVDLLTSV